MAWDQIRRLISGQAKAKRAQHHFGITKANKARLASFRQNSEHMRGIRWLAALDGNCCIACAALDGAEWDFDGNPISDHAFVFQVPPLHENCRCVLSPLAMSLDDLLGLSGLNEQLEATRTRASASGPTSAKTYEEFLRQQPEPFVLDFLGEERTALFLVGGATLQDFVDRVAQVLPIEQVSPRL